MKDSIFKLLRRLGRGLGGRGLGLRKLPGAMSLYEYFYAKVAPEGVVLVEVQGSRMYVNPADEPVGRSLITQGSYERCETELFRSLIAPGMTVVDIGANIGYYTLIAAALVGVSGKVYAFEPEPSNYGLLTRNIEANGYANVLALPEAVSDRAGSVTLYIDSQNCGNRSFSKRNIVHDGGVVDVATTTLDSLWLSGKIASEIDVIKIDAQGSEGLIVKGAKQILKNQHPKLLMEFEPVMLKNNGTEPLELIEELESYGYDFKLIDSEHNGLRPVKKQDLLAECQRDGYIDLFLEKTLAR